MMKQLSLFFFIHLSTSILVSSCGDDEESCTETTWYEDADGDGQGNPDATQAACEQPTGFVSNNRDDDDTTTGSAYVVKDVDAAHFLTDGTDFTNITLDCTLSDGSSSTCYQIVTNGQPSDHNMGNWARKPMLYFK